MHRLVRSLARGPRVEDAAVVFWPAGRERLVAWQVQDLAGERSLAGAFWGMLVGLLFLLPLSRVGGAGHLEGADWSQDGLSRLGLDGAFAESVRRVLVPGTSALFTVHPGADAAVPAAALPADAVLVGRFPLAADQWDDLHAGFGEGRAAHPVRG